MLFTLPTSGERFAALALWCVQGQTQARIRALVARMGSLEGALAAVPEARAAGLRAVEQGTKLGAWVLLPGDSEWPSELEKVSPGCGALFGLGGWPVGDRVSIVGSRRATANGMVFARRLAADLAAAGVTVVSGGAEGIDAAAHQGALDGDGGATIAVLGGGLDIIYPPQHKGLFREIAARGGAVVSEYPFGTPTLPELFPRRNRLIAALGGATVVVEAANRSGSLVTARRAAELGRPLLAVPGAPGQAVSEGTNALLKAGARLCDGAGDVLAVLGRSSRGPADIQASNAEALVFDGDAGALVSLLSLTPTPLDELSRLGGLGPARTAAAVTHLELFGVLRRVDGGRVCRRADFQSSPPGSPS